MFSPESTSVRRWRSTIAITVGFVVVVLGIAGTVGVGLSVVLSPLWGVTPGAIAAGLLMSLGAVGLLMLSRRVAGHGWTPGVRLAPSGRDIALLVWGAIVLALAVTATHVVTAAVGWSRFDVGAETPSWEMIGMTLTVGFIVQGFPEELVFRGYVINLFAGRGLPETVAASAVSFGVIHLLSRIDAVDLAQQLMWTVMATLLGAALALLRIGFDSLWIAVGAHGGFHLARAIAAEISPYPDLTAESAALIVGLAILCGLLTPLARRKRRQSRDRAATTVTPPA